MYVCYAYYKVLHVTGGMTSCIALVLGRKYVYL